MQAKYDKNISLDEVLTLWHNMYGEDMEQEYGSFIEALSNSGSEQDKITIEKQELKQMIIENYINWFTSNQEERDSMIKGAKCYVSEDLINELEEN